MKVVQTQKVLLLVAAALIATESAVRLAGAVDFPIYSVTPQIGYIPKPSQQGKFLKKNDWYFNSRSMGNKEPYAPAAALNVFIIGNSIVMGGNPYKHEEKVSALYAKEIQNAAPVWSVAAGGWSNVNEIEYLRMNPDITNGSNIYLWEYMNSGLSELSTWRGEYVFPTKNPLWATAYVFQRYILPKIRPQNRNELPPAGQDKEENIVKFQSMLAHLRSKSTHPKVGIVFYVPNKTEYQKAKSGQDWMFNRQRMNKLAADNAFQTLDIAQDPLWNEAYYKSDGTHLTVDGNKALAKILAKASAPLLTH